LLPSELAALRASRPQANPGQALRRIRNRDYETEYLLKRTTADTARLSLGSGRAERRRFAGVSLLAVLLLASLPTCLAQTAAWEKARAEARDAYQQGRFDEAENRRKIALSEARALGSEDVRLITSLKELAEVYQVQGKHSEAEELLVEALGLREKALALNCISN